MFDKLSRLRERALQVVQKASWAGPLLARLTVGIVFVGTGWGKLHNLDDVTKFFGELHIPAPHFNAVLAASAEFFCGLALVFGVLTRLAAIPLITTMVVAILTAKRSEIDGVPALLGLEEFSYLTFFVWLALAGPGKASIDHLLARLFVARERTRQAQPLLTPSPTAR